MTQAEIRGVGLAVLAAAGTSALTFVLSFRAAVMFLGLITLVAYAVYPGLAVQRAEPRVLSAETMLLLIGVVSVAAGLLLHHAWIAAGLALHGAIDLAHERPARRLVSQTPRWYTRFCLVYDWVVAAVIPFAMR